MAPVHYREYPPAPPLRRVVDCVWFLSRPRGASGSDPVQRIPPDGSIELIFHLGERFVQVNGVDRTPQAAALIVGVWTQPIALAAPLAFDTVGVRIRPGGGSAFWPVSAASFTDAAVDAAAVLGRDVRDLWERLGTRVGDQARVADVSAFLNSRLRPDRTPIAGALARIAGARGRASLDLVARDCGVGARRLERAFQRHVGVSPKMFSRIVRFQEVLRRAPARPADSGTPESWADVAIGCGYADQSHLIRDFAQFTGDTPAALRAAEPELADYFRRR